MKKQLILCGMALTLLASCSSGDDLLAEQPVTSVGETSGLDDENVTRESLMGTFPIEFAGVGLGGDATVEESSMTRASSGFSVDNVGVFCLSTAKMPDVEDDTSILDSWSGQVGTKLNILNMWQNNARAHVETAAGTTGRIVWDDVDVARYYPAPKYFKYNFVAYHPYTKAIQYSKRVLYAYFIVDGDDDIMHAMPDAPHTATGKNEIDDLAYSNEYFTRLAADGKDLSGDDYKPFFSFKHLMAKLKFHVKLKDTSSPAHELTAGDQGEAGFASVPRRAGADPEFRVDSICFSGFINVVRLTLMRSQSGVISAGDLSYGFNPSTQSEDIQAALGTSADETKGHFWLREADGTSIRDKKEGGVYKYKINSGTYTEVGDGILIPPVVENYNSANILLQVFLSDKDGKRTQVFVTLKRPAEGWQSGKQFNVYVQITPPTNDIGQARADVVNWGSTDDIVISD